MAIAIPYPNDAVIRLFGGVMIDPAACSEVRIFNSQFNFRSNIVERCPLSRGTIGGWFNDTEAFLYRIKEARQVSCYLTVNPVHKKFIDQCSNKFKYLKKGESCNKDDILVIRNLFIDIDPLRHPKETSATEEELALALSRRDAILGDFPEIAQAAFWGCSGNGGYIVARLPDYPNDEQHRKFVGDALSLLGSRYGDNRVDVDCKVRDPSRVMCVPGTLKCKGENTEERPWRLATIDYGFALTGIPPVPLDLVGFVARNPRPKVAGVQAPPHTPPRAYVAGRPPKRGEGGGGRGDGGGKRQPPRGETETEFRLRRAEAYIMGPNFGRSISGQHGHDQFFDAVCALVKGFDLTIDQARPIARVYAEQKSDPPWSVEETEHKLEEADKKPDDRPRGYLFDQDRPEYEREQREWREFEEARGQGDQDGGEDREGGDDPRKPDLDYIERRYKEIIELKGFEFLIQDNEFLSQIVRLELSDYQRFEAVCTILSRELKGFRERKFRKILKPFRESLMPPQPEAETEILGADRNPHRLARLYLSECYTYEDELTLRFWREEFHAWDGSSYKIVPSKELRADVARIIDEEFVSIYEQKLETRGGFEGEEIILEHVTTNLVSDVIQAISGMTLMKVIDYDSQPTWVNKSKNDWYSKDVMSMKDSIIHIPSFVSGDSVHSIPQTPNLFNPFAIDYKFNPDAPNPNRFFDFLDSVWGSDYATIEALQEWFGYLLLPDTSQQKMLMLIGPTRSGKGTIGRVIEKVVGKANVVWPTLSSLITPFGLSALIGKSIGIVSEAKVSNHVDGVQIVEKVLSITGEDSQTINRKFLPPITMRLPTRFVILSNEIPKLSEASGALVGRAIILEMTKSYLDREDRELDNNLSKELPGILLWALEGWKRFRERGYLVQPDSGVPLIRDMSDMGSPIGAFVRENCVIGSDQSIETHVLFEEWKRWCERQNNQGIGNASAFGCRLRSVVPGLTTRQKRTPAGRVYYFIGVGYNPYESTGQGCEEFGEHLENGRHKGEVPF
jgi:putative DNA primase/helicase